MKRSIIVYGPQGCGKTTHAEKIAAHFKLEKIRDGFAMSDQAPFFDTLILTNEKPSKAKRMFLKCLSFSQAMKQVLP